MAIQRLTPEEQQTQPNGTISPEDLDLFEYADSPGEAFGILRRRFEDYFGSTPVAARTLP